MGTRICFRGERLLRLNVLGESESPDARRPVSLKNFESEVLVALDAGRSCRRDIVAVSDSYSTLLRPGVSFEILEVGREEQEGLLKLRSSSEYSAFWVEVRDLRYDWAVDQRVGKPLEGARLEQVCDPKSRIKIREHSHSPDDIRKFTIEAMRLRQSALNAAALEQPAQ